MRRFLPLFVRLGSVLLVYFFIRSVSRNPSKMPENARKTAVIASLVADSLALGGHWVYDTSLLQKNPVRDLQRNTFNKYHDPKEAGAQTHYGDQVLLLLDAVNTEKKNIIPTFRQKWFQYWQTSTSYKDHATKDTLSKGAQATEGSASSDLSGAARIAPLLYATKNEEELVQLARAQTIITHTDARVVATSEFFARLLFRQLYVSPSTTPIEHVRALVAAIPTQYTHLSLLLPLIEAGLKTSTQSNDSGFAISCDIAGALPGTIHFIAKYGQSKHTPSHALEEALIANVMIGGDQAARGLLIGAVLGAWTGAAVPERWIQKWQAAQVVEHQLQALSA